MHIKLLNPYLINQIAAGEIIDRPSSIVKELLENSFDAGAKKIFLDIKGGGIKLIRLTDNGCGILKEDLNLALARHATSKIKTFDDLKNIKSLGFRGEALASISAVSDLNIISRTDISQIGWGISSSGNTIHSPLYPLSHQIGTTVEVSNLFFNLPVRRKFLKNKNVEFNNILKIVNQLSLSYFDIEFIMKHDGIKILELSKSNNKIEDIERIKKIIGIDFIPNTYEIDVCNDILKLTGWMSNPRYTRSQPDIQYIYVNGRIIKNKLISHAIKQAYCDVIFGQRHPLIILYLYIDNSFIDVNVHPSKTEIRFCNEKFIHDFIVDTLKNILSKNTSKIKDIFLSSKKEENLVFQEQYSLFESDNLLNSNYTFVDIKDNSNLDLGIPITQLNDTYILSKNVEGLIIVDIHAAHERINYEKFKKSYYEKSIQKQLLLIPINIILNKNEFFCIENNLELFESFGFDITIVSYDSILVRSIPSLLYDLNISILIKDLIADLLSYDSPDSILMHTNERLAMIACHKSMKFKSNLNYDDMNDLLRTLEKTDNGNQCNHGRPTWIIIKNFQLNKMFLRKK